MSLANLARDILSLTTNVNRLTADIAKIADKVDSHSQRITRLEGVGDNTKTAAESIAIKAAASVHETLLLRMIEIEKKVDESVMIAPGNSDGRELPKP
jgi:hypothetical protein